jgi:hypothetical protein
MWFRYRRGALAARRLIRADAPRLALDDPERRERLCIGLLMATAAAAIAGMWSPSGATNCGAIGAGKELLGDGPAHRMSPVGQPFQCDDASPPGEKAQSSAARRLSMRKTWCEPAFPPRLSISLARGDLDRLARSVVRLAQRSMVLSLVEAEAPPNARFEIGKDPVSPLRVQCLEAVFEDALVIHAGAS